MTLSWVIQDATFPYPVPPSYPRPRRVEPVRRIPALAAIQEGTRTPVELRQGQAARRAYHESEEDSRPGRQARFAADLMSTPVITLRADASTADAAEILRLNRFRHLPVVDGDGILVGIVSDRDLPRIPDPLPGPLAEVMTRKVLTGSSGTEISAIARVLVRERIHCLPIVDEFRRPVGILTTTDILRALVDEAPLDLWF